MPLDDRGGQAAGRKPQPGSFGQSLLLLDEGAFDHVIPSLANVWGDFEAITVEHGGNFLEHGRTAADHGAVGCRVERRLANILEQFARLDQVGLPTFIAERLTGDGRVIDQLAAYFIAQIFVFLQVLLDVVVIGQFVGPADAVDQDDFFEAFIGFRIVDQAQIGRASCRERVS
jgi:hypothetical protein